ncbi:hypothetical protein ATANTOWER_003766 [Ataeniobius toweri]|uniref:Uncharacterized protein n=1 Tax=Ataeniobius toweri TaxID=208326 RepID=A0ABU7BPG5_9TELE|nr:hypothetical protein [Ataeniobius toweri]
MCELSLFPRPKVVNYMLVLRVSLGLWIRDSEGPSKRPNKLPHGGTGNHTKRGPCAGCTFWEKGLTISNHMYYNGLPLGLTSGPNSVNASDKPFSCLSYTGQTCGAQ